MVRKLMIEILSKETLKKSSSTGKGGWTPIPADAFDDVEMFFQNNVKKRYRLTHDEYMECLTSQCATLRNPKPPTGSGTVKGLKMNKKIGTKQNEIGNQRKNEPVESDRKGQKQRKDVQKSNPKEVLATQDRGSSEDEEEETYGNEEEGSRENSIMHGEASSSESGDPSDNKATSGDNLRSLNGKNDVQLVESDRRRGRGNQQTSRYRRKVPTRQNDIVSTDNEVPNASLNENALALLDSPQTIFRQSNPHSRTSSTEVGAAITNSTPEKSSVYERGGSVPLSPGSSPQRNNDSSKCASEVSDIGRMRTSKSDEKLPSNESECNLQEISKRVSGYLVRIKELEKMLADESKQNNADTTGENGSRSKESPGEKICQSIDDDSPIPKKKLKT
ncbi:hypothetical protein QAD02_018409 [Eretmocerus hayati]|uniref:Uncharacterized protein n=1 Tax=Eretmocerus hayati TaxID=131215 RepID=A0ACC2PJN5_9HYME|nr:hypothetical protein QAD02_018409 [Eretmocerus hayati]